jgi:hypothetical protein
MHNDGDPSTTNLGDQLLRTAETKLYRLLHAEPELDEEGGPP